MQKHLCKLFEKYKIVTDLLTTHLNKADLRIRLTNFELNYNSNLIWLIRSSKGIRGISTIRK